MTEPTATPLPDLVPIMDIRTAPRVELKGPIPQPQRPSASPLERIVAVFALATAIATEAVQAAAEFLATRPGAERKAYVVDETMRAVRAAEAHANLLPAVIEPAVMAAVELVLRSFVVDRVLRELEQRGVV